MLAEESLVAQGGELVTGGWVSYPVSPRVDEAANNNNNKSITKH